MIKIIFVRHGRDKNDKLTRLGIKQAKMAVKELEYENIDKVFCSPKGRTLQTANIIAKRLKINQVSIDERIVEREKIGEKVDEKTKQLYDANYLNPNFSHKNPEGCKEYYDRIVEFLNDILQKANKDETILIVGHSSMCYVMNAYFCHKPSNKFLDWIRLGNCSKICFEYEK